MRNRIEVVKVFAIALACAATAWGQFGPPAAVGSGGAQPSQLPLSGRTGASGSVTATQTAVPGTTNSVNTINPSVQTQGAYAGSVPSTAKTAFSGKLSLQDAVKRALEFNLGSVGLSLALEQAKGQQRVVRSALMPNVNGTVSENVQEVNLRAQGLRISSPFPGFGFPSIVGPYNYFDLRARLSQTVADMTALNNYRSAKELVRASQFSAQDSKDLVVLAVGGAYLQVIAAKARVESAKAQLDAATALFNQTQQQKNVGLVAQIDVNRNEVQVLTQKQRLSSLQNDLSKQKINLARITGLPPNDNFDITDNVPFAAAPLLTEGDVIRQALMQRADVKAADAQVKAAEKTVSAARAERLPSLALNGDYGVIGTNPAQSHSTFSVSGTLRIPIWQGGKTEGDIEEANAELSQRRAELEDLKSQVESQVRNAFLDLEAATSQVDVARRNLDVTRETLDLTRQRLEAGVTDTVDVSQAQATVASAELDYINAVFAHNVAKLSLARATGGADQNLGRYLALP